VKQSKGVIKIMEIAKILFLGEGVSIYFDNIKVVKNGVAFVYYKREIIAVVNTSNKLRYTFKQTNILGKIYYHFTFNNLETATF
jgi:hypothetical protein